MKPLTEFLGCPLVWGEPKVLEKSFELRSEREELVATLGFHSAFGSLAEAVTAHGTWTFKRVGFFSPRVTLRVQGEETDLAVYQPKMLGGGTLIWADGACLQWVPGNFWQTEWTFADSAQRPVVQFAPGPSPSGLSDIFKTRATVTVQPSGLGVDQLALLAALGFYLIVLHGQDASAGAAVACSCG
jgi:hypothetical protein